jgi:hypothetical protein
LCQKCLGQLDFVGESDSWFTDYGRRPDNLYDERSGLPLIGFHLERYSSHYDGELTTVEEYQCKICGWRGGKVTKGVFSYDYADEKARYQKHIHKNIFSADM